MTNETFSIKPDMEELLHRITFNRKILAGKPVIRGLRISVEMILDLLSKGASEQEILQDYPELEPEDIRAALAYACRLVAGETIVDRISAWVDFLADVNAGTAVVEWLTEHNHDVARVAAIDPGMDDEEILRWAVLEERIIVTTDQDFEEMVWRAKLDHRGILRLENLPREQRLRLLEDVVFHHRADLEAGAIVIALRRKTRVRR